MSANNFFLDNISVLIDDRINHDHAMDVRLACQSRINGRRTEEQARRFHIASNADWPLWPLHGWHCRHGSRNARHAACDPADLPSGNATGDSAHG